jgi:putative peptidoglycan lipid II flippase
VGLFTAAYSGYSFTRGIQFGTGQVVRATTWDVLSAVGGIAALAAVLATGARGGVLLLPLVLSYGAYTLASWPRDVRRHAPLDPALRRELDHVIVLGVSGTLASAGFLQIAMIVAKGTDPEGAGQFAAAMATATPASLLATSLSLVLFPSLAEAWGRGDREQFADQTDRAARVLMVVMVTIFGSLALCSRLVMGLLWGEGFDADSPIFPLLVVAIMCTTVAVPAVNALMTRSRRLMQVTSGASFAGLCTGALAWWLLTPSLGAEGVALGFLLGSLVSGGVPQLAEWRVGQHRWTFHLLRLPVAVALVAALLLGTRALGLGPWWEPVSALVFCLAWWGLCWRDLRLVPVPGLRRP